MLDTRIQLIETLVAQMPEPHRAFRIFFERSEPDWDGLGLPHVKDLPAVRWRQLNLDKLSDEKRAALVADLEVALQGG